MTTIKLPTGTFEYDPAKPLGRKGGFGQVFAGRNPNGEEIAVKKLHVAAADAGHRELRIAEEFRGRTFEHVMEFIDSGEDADSGDYFVVMPRAERSLQANIDSKWGINISDMASILRQIASGLQEVGSLVHRDLKPDNILFHQGKWKVADFGIARFSEEATSSNTVKGWLSELYAAPEQFRHERATHATDVYALGCIAFCLLTNKPPFTTDPASEHQRSPLPVFLCADPRFSSLINMMLRKPPQSRPVLTRVVQALDGIISAPHIVRDNGPWSLLANASAQIATAEQEQHARMEEQRIAAEARDQLAAEAYQILMDNLERFWGKIHASAPNAQRPSRSREGYFECQLGSGQIVISMTSGGALEKGVFRHSGWDVVASGGIQLSQNNPPCTWSASLWYVKLKGETEYRWREVSYWIMGASPAGPYAAQSPGDADIAASNISSVMNIAFGPEIIDCEKEDDFHERWIWLLSKAALKQLRFPSCLPIRGWPPQL